jgi:hypothetical protein
MEVLMSTPLEILFPKEIKTLSGKLADEAVASRNKKPGTGPGLVSWMRLAKAFR